MSKRKILAGLLLLILPAIALADTATIVSFDTGIQTVLPGGTASLSWNVTNITPMAQCSIGPSNALLNGVTPSSPPSSSVSNWTGGYATAPIQTTTTYTISCGSITKSTTISIAQPAASVTTTSSGINNNPGIAVSGNRLLRNGQPFTVKGLNVTIFIPKSLGVLMSGVVSEWSKSPFAEANTRTALLKAARDNWKSNTIRIPVMQTWLDPSDTSLTAAQRSIYISEIVQATTEATNAGFSVIITMFNQLPIPGTNEYPNTGDCMATAATWRAWQGLLPLVKGNSLVMPDLFNEPGAFVYPGWDIWKNGGAFMCGQFQNTALGMQTLVTNMRQAGVQNVLVVEPLGYFKADTDPSHLVSDPLGQVAYAVHPYVYGIGSDTDTYGLKTGSSFSTSTNAAILDVAFGNAAKSIPLIANEWDLIQFSGSKISCQDVPQIGYFLTAYIQRNLPAGSAVNGFDDPPWQLTSDLNYTPRGYANVAKCGTAVGDPITKNIGDVGALVYAWYNGADIWHSTGWPVTQTPPLSTSLTIGGQHAFVHVGQNYPLSWSSTGASSCKLSWNRTDGYVPATDSLDLGLIGSGSTGLIGTYTFTCVNEVGQSTSDSVTITTPTTPTPPAASPISSPIFVTTPGPSGSIPNIVVTMQPSAATTLGSSQTPAEKIAVLLAQLSALQETLSKIKKGNGTSSSLGSPPISYGACPVIARTLSRGTRGSDVLALQKFFLTQDGNFGADYATGYFGAMTEAALKQWQSEHKLVSSGSPNTTGWGVVGPKTRAALLNCNS